MFRQALRYLTSGGNPILKPHFRYTGVTPDEIENATGRKLFAFVEGTVEGEAFRTELARRRPNDVLAHKRYFSRDDQLFVVDHKTYALTNQWSKAKMEPTMAALIAKYGSFGLSYGVAENQAET